MRRSNANRNRITGTSLSGLRAAGGKKRAFIAIARMILTAIYHMLTNGELFNPSDWKHDNSSDALQNQRKETIRRAVKLLKQHAPLSEEVATQLQQLIECA